MRTTPHLTAAEWVASMSPELGAKIWAELSESDRNDKCQYTSLSNLIACCIDWKRAIQSEQYWVETHAAIKAIERVYRMSAMGLEARHIAPEALVEILESGK